MTRRADDIFPAHRAVDWAELAARVEDSARATGEASDPAADDPAAAARILEERARRLAVRPDPEDGGERIELLSFTLAGSPFAIEAGFVVAVVRGVEPTPLPAAAAPVAAVVPWRGRVMTALDLHTVLAVAGVTADATTGGGRLMLVLGEADPELGILVDGVSTLVTLPLSELHEVPQGTPARVEYLRAMTPDAVPVLDAAAILRLHALDDSLDAAPDHTPHAGDA